MDTRQARRLDEQLQIIRDLVPSVVSTVDRLIGNFEQFINFGLVDAGGAGKGREPLVGLQGR